MKTLIWIFLAAIGALSAQQVVAPGPEALGSARGENQGNYNITNSFETGYRFSLVGGDLGEYRSDVNYRNGLRLLGSSLSIDSKDGHGGKAALRLPADGYQAIPAYLGGSDDTIKDTAFREAVLAEESLVVVFGQEYRGQAVESLVAWGLKRGPNSGSVRFA